jgi:hypothetical protein
LFDKGADGVWLEAELDAAVGMGISHGADCDGRRFGTRVSVTLQHWDDRPHEAIVGGELRRPAISKHFL